MYQVYDKEMKKVAVLHLAYNRTEEKRLNGIDTVRFSLPADDPKRAHCRLHNFVRAEDGALYRIISEEISRANEEECKYVAEHCITTLMDSIMPGTYAVGGTTREVVAYLLNMDRDKRWTLNECDFNLSYEYKYESENVLNALHSVPSLITEPYMWSYENMTPGTRWTLSLKRLNAAKEPAFWVQPRKNLVRSSYALSAEDLCTRLYMYGAGQGPDRVTISSRNGGLPYVQSNQYLINAYGLISKVYVDSTIEDAETLLQRAKALLNRLQYPRETRRYKVADLYEVTGRALDNARLGDMVGSSIDDLAYKDAAPGDTIIPIGASTRSEEPLFITGIKRNLDKPGDMEIELSNRPNDIVADIVDIASQQRVEQMYVRGTMQILNYSHQETLEGFPSMDKAKLHFMVPSSMLRVDSVRVYVSMEGTSPSTLNIYDGETGQLWSYLLNADREKDITRELLVNGKIPRDTWMCISVNPDKTATVTINMSIQGYVEASGEGGAF